LCLQLNVWLNFCRLFNGKLFCSLCGFIRLNIFDVVVDMDMKTSVFGRDIRTPTLNVADIFLNGGQNRVPGRNFARFMLLMFVIWTLIIKTCYQSILYKNLQLDMRRPAIKTFDGTLLLTLWIFLITFDVAVDMEIKTSLFDLKLSDLFSSDS
jgi:hypothetical protein